MQKSSPSRFPNYLELRERSRVPAWVWEAGQWLGLVVVVAVVLVLFVRPEAGLLIFWGLAVPAVPLIFFIVPGVWRNTCPLATTNQLPRRWNFSKAINPPVWWQEYGFVIGCAALFLLASSRKWLFNTHGPATAVLILVLLGLAFVGGWLFKGKSGWCSTICPLYPVQRLYNQTPFVLLPNHHCPTCVGCTKNCYDFNPRAAYLSDLAEEDRYYSGYRKFFAAAMPGFIFAYFHLPGPPAVTLAEMYLQFASAMAVSIGGFHVADTFLKVSTNKLTVLAAATALNLFYFSVFPVWFKNIGTAFGCQLAGWLPWLAQGALLAVTFAWIIRSFAKERDFLAQLQSQAEARLSTEATQVIRKLLSEDKFEIKFMPGTTRVMAQQNRTLLEIAESNQQKIESGCRMGMCGADPVLILAGENNVSPLKDDEKATLSRLGLGTNARLACMCRVRGPVTVDLNATATPGVTASAEPAPAFDRAIKRIVIIGNGIAGVTVADDIRRQHPDCEIHLVSREKHLLYNRMAISRLIYGRSAMEGLYLHPQSWYDERKITCWLNTQATAVVAKERRVVLATGESLAYDRLILTTGSASFVPPLPGFGLAGTFVLREAEDAMGLRAYVQQHHARHAVVAGGGLLGLEAAYALYKLGLEVTVLERGKSLLNRQLDERGAALLQIYLERLGLRILTEAECAEIRGENCAEQILLKNGQTLKADLVLVAAGIKPNVDLAQSAEIEVNRAIVVDAALRTNDPAIFAAGDACEFEGVVPGLWSVATEQAHVAAANALGGREIYRPMPPVTALKVVGVDLTSMGTFKAQAGDSEIALENLEKQTYRKLVLRQGKIIGAILLGHPAETPVVLAAIKDARDITAQLESLRSGSWNILES